jgi:hypothetical protein
MQQFDRDLPAVGRVTGEKDNPLGSAPEPSE